MTLHNPRVAPIRTNTVFAIHHNKPKRKVRVASKPEILWHPLQHPSREYSEPSRAASPQPAQECFRGERGRKTGPGSKTQHWPLPFSAWQPQKGEKRKCGDTDQGLALQNDFLFFPKECFQRTVSPQM